MSMSELSTEADSRIALPLLPLASGENEPSSAGTDWHGWTALTPPSDAPEPMEPQGAYSEAGLDFSLPLPEPSSNAPRGSVELLAPAGGPDAAFAAFHFGADAVYLGLKK